MTTKTTISLLAGSLLLCAPIAVGQTDAIWTGGAGDGLYSNILNWDIGVVPINDGMDTYNVFISAAIDIFFDLDDPGAVTDLTLGASQNLRINPGHSLTVLDDAVINGVVTVENSSFLAQAAGAAFGDSNNTRLFADGGGQIAIAGTVYSSAALPSSYTLFSSHGTGTLIDLSSLTLINAGFNGPGGTQVQTFNASAGGIIDLSDVQTLVGPYDLEDRLDIIINSEGQIDLTNLQEIYSSSAGDVRFEVNVPSYELLNLSTAQDAQFVMTPGCDLSLPSLWTFAGDISVPTDSSVDMPVLQSMTGGSLTADAGGVLSAPVLTSFTNSLLIVEGGATITMPALQAIDNSRFYADSGSTVLVTAESYTTTALPSNYTLISAGGTGTLVDMAQVQTINAGFNGAGGTQVQTIESSSEATVDLSGVKTIIGPLDPEDRLDIIVNPDAQINLFGLQEIYSTSTGDVRFELNVPSYEAGNLLTASDVIFDLLPGCDLSLPALWTLNGTITVPSTASVSMPALESMTGGALTIQSGGALAAPLLTSLTGTLLTIDGAATLDLPSFQDLDNSRLDLAGGSSITTATEGYSSTGLPGTYTLFSAHGTGTLLDMSSLQGLDAGFNGPGGTQVHTIRADASAVLDLSNVESISRPYDPEDRVDVSVTGGATIDLSSLATAPGNGYLRFSVAGQNSTLNLSMLGLFDEPQQFTLESECTAILGGLGVVGSGTFGATADVFGYPTANVAGSMQNHTTTESSFLSGDLKLTMSSDYALFEAASYDDGAIEPTPDSFELGELTFDAPTGRGEGLIVFVENFDNGNRIDTSTPEAVYITGHDDFDGIPALNGGTLLLNGLNVYVLDDVEWINLHDLAPPIGTVAYKDGFIANRLEDMIGDANGDCFVDVLDLISLLAVWGTANPVYDFNGDGIVDVLDLIALLGNWGGVCP